MKDFEYAFLQVRASVGTDDLEGYLQWNEKYGSMGTVSFVCFEDDYTFCTEVFCERLKMYMCW